MRAASGTAPGGSGAIGESSVISGSGDKRAGHEDGGVGLDAAAAGGCAAGRGGCAGRRCTRGHCLWRKLERCGTQNLQPAQYNVSTALLEVRCWHRWRVPRRWQLRKHVISTALLEVRWQLRKRRCT